MKAALIALGLIAMAAPASAQSFSCRNADSAAEQTICESGRLRALDVRMNRAYLRALRDDARHAARIQRRQRDWLASRNSCGRNDRCIARHYTERLSELR